MALVPPRALVAAFDRLAEPTFRQFLSLDRQIPNLRQARDLLLPRLRLPGQVNTAAVDELICDRPAVSLNWRKPTWQLDRYLTDT